MQSLPDTHTLLRRLSGSPRPSPAARRAIEDTTNEVMVGAASAWETAAKHRLGKLPGGEESARDVRGAAAGRGFQESAITAHDVERAGRPAGPHRDPFDRMRIAQPPA